MTMTDVPPKPVPFQRADLSKLPEDLAPLTALPRWVPWYFKLEETKWTKPPVGSTNEKKTWRTYEAAVAAKRDGIGICFSPDWDVAGVDMDDCLRQEGENLVPKDWAKPIIELAFQSGCYIEVTPSGRGIHIIGKTSRQTPLTHAPKWGPKGAQEGFEIYVRSAGRYFTVSGIQWGRGSPLAPIDAVIDEILKRHPKEEKAAYVASEPGWRIRPNDPPDKVEDELMARITGPLSEHDAKDKSAAFHGVVSDLLYANYSIDDIVLLMDPYPDGVAMRFISENRLAKMVASSFDKLRAEFQAEGARHAQLLNRPPALAQQPVAPVEATQNMPIPEPGSWRSKAVRSNKQIVSNTANAQLAIETDFPGAFAFDEMAQEAVANIGGERVRLTDAHIIEIQVYLQRQGLLRVSKDAVHDAVVTVARRHPFHPVRDYLNGLKWDKVERLPTLLSTYFGAPQNEYTAAVGKMFLISAVARIMQPGCQADYVLSLEGEQGELKSSACRVLFGSAHFLDHLPPLKNKDSSQILRGKWGIECAEMRAFSSAKIAETKEFITRRNETYFARYGRSESKEPRQCVIIISTNESIYLYDTTGNRRYWPVLIGTIDLAALKRDRDALWAEAKARYDKGEHWWPTREFERKHILPEQEAREAPEHPWYEVIATWADRALPDGRLPDRVMLSDVMQGALRIEPDKMERKDSDQLAGILSKLGWKRGPKVKGQQLWLRGTV